MDTSADPNRLRAVVGVIAVNRVAVPDALLDSRQPPRCAPALSVHVRCSLPSDTIKDKPRNWYEPPGIFPRIPGKFFLISTIRKLLLRAGQIWQDKRSFRSGNSPAKHNGVATVVAATQHVTFSVPLAHANRNGMIVGGRGSVRTFERVDLTESCSSATTKGYRVPRSIHDRWRKKPPSVWGSRIVQVSISHDHRKLGDVRGDASVRASFCGRLHSFDAGSTPHSHQHLLARLLGRIRGFMLSAKCDWEPA